MAFSKLKRFFLGGSDPHAQRAAPDYRSESDNTRKGAVGPDVSWRDELVETGDDVSQNPITPPPSARTDRARGTGELGAEQIDPDRPLSE